jgi:hypothetical protein
MNVWKRSLPTLALLGLAAGLQAAPGADLTRRRARAYEALALRPGPSLAISTVYDSVPAEKRFALLDQLRRMVLAQVPPDLLRGDALAKLPEKVRMEIGTMLALAKVVTPEQLDAFVQNQDLDHLAPLPSHLFQFYHQKVMAEPGPDGSTPRAAMVAQDVADPAAWRARVEATPGYLGEDRPTRLRLLGPGDAVPAAEVPRDRQTPAPGGLGIKAGFVLRRPEHVLVNSVRLSNAFNHLTNAGKAPLTVELPGYSGEVGDGVGLVNALLAAGYELQVFDARMYVNFVNLWVPHGEHLLPVRIPTWAATDLDPSDPEGEPAGPGEERVLVPVDHSEHLLGVYRPGDELPQAMVRWFMAIPDSEGPAQGTTFKPAIWQRAGWSGYRVVRAYAGKHSARHMIDTAGRLMRLFNAMQSRYGFPYNGYGALAVCNDTTALMEVGLQGQTGRSTVWPLLRDPTMDALYADSLEHLGVRMRRGAAGARVLTVPSDARPDHYPWVANRRILLHRVGANISTRDPATIHFPSLKRWTESMAAKSPTFARSLGSLRITR